MTISNCKPSSRKSKQTLPDKKAQAKKQVSPLRQRFIRDMELAGLADNTQQAYIGAVVKIQDHYHSRPDKLTEKQVQQYIFWLRDEKQVPKGTFQTQWSGLKFFYYRCLCVDGSLFTRKKVRKPRRQRLPVPIAWNDGHRLIGAIRKPGYRLCCSLMLALGLRIGDVLALTVSSIDSTQIYTHLTQPMQQTLRHQLDGRVSMGIAAEVGSGCEPASSNIPFCCKDFWASCKTCKTSSDARLFREMALCCLHRLSGRRTESVTVP